ncbi:ATP-grasp domain-containing protein [Fodinibius saliphilus]|uniref:ATP-grasp domain-containing protein n=1 Tax=Fodinibius saliphilus TaxID=1920650 RepID=UPI0011085AF4|nr:hypothetical protein [Fodinibius saliphilus]
MKRCAFLSMDNLDDFEVYDELLYEPLQNRGWKVDEISWRNKSVDWDQYEAVIIRSPWDYQEAPNAFIEVLEEIESSTAILENSLDIVKWNINKRYLRDLENDGIEIVPTLWQDEFHEDQLPSFFDELDSDEIVIKPTISAGADNTFWVKETNQQEYINILTSVFKDQPFLVQPFMQNIVNEGEFSVFFFGDTYSHTILKTPKVNDFRVQEEHGGRLKKVKPEKQLLSIARESLANITPLPLYTRADYVRTDDNSFALMELELIEPSLYFNMDSESPERFAEVFNNRMEKRLASIS